MIYFLLAIVALALAVSIARYCMMKSELTKLADAMDDNHAADTCRQLTIGVRQTQISRLASSINTLYDDIDTDRAANRMSLEELRKDMTNISHDLRTPLTSIIGYIKLMQNDSASAEKQRHYLTVVSQKAQDLNSLVSGLFELTLLESGDHLFQYRQCDANAMLTEELAGIYTQFDKQDIPPEVKLQEGPIWIIGDNDALHRIFSNLLQNMVKHGQAPMQISSCVENGCACFLFSNKAPKLQDEDIPLLFQRFFTADRMRSGNDTGLGLAIVKEFTGQLGGNISAGLQDGLLTISLSFRLVDKPFKQ